MIGCWLHWEVAVYPLVDAAGPPLAQALEHGGPMQRARTPPPDRQFLMKEHIGFKKYNA